MKNIIIMEIAKDEMKKHLSGKDGSRMEKPNYVIRATEAVVADKYDSKLLRIMRTITCVIVVIVIVATILFQENIFMALSFRGKIILIGLVVMTISTSGTIRIPSEFELQFYDEYFILYREKFPYNKNFSRKEIEKMYYKDVKEFQYRQQSKRINFVGVNEGIYWEYKEDGTLSAQPSYHKTTDSILYFYTEFSDVDFIKEIEEHSPLRVEIRNS